MAGDTYLLYTDDSGEGSVSFYSALLMPIAGWTVALDQWLKYRRWLHKAHGVPASFELHAYEWIPGKGPDPVPSKPQAPINRVKGLRQEVAKKGLQTIKAMHDVGVVTCRHPSGVRADAYERLLELVDSELRRRDAWAVVVVDGDPKNPDPHVRDAHRGLKLKDRRIVEDGWVQNAEVSQFIQMADLVVHSAFQADRRLPARMFMWDWYAAYVHDREWICSCPP